MSDPANPLIRVLILPGRGNSGPTHWQSVWEAADTSLVRVQQLEWDNPDRADWVASLDTAINADDTDDTPVVLVAHSLSVLLVAHWATRHTGPVKAALLVAPSDVEREDYAKGTTGFAPIPLQPLPFKTIVVASDNDPRVTIERASAFANAWGAELKRAGAYGHLGSAANLGEWPFGKALLDELRAHASRLSRQFAAA